MNRSTRLERAQKLIARARGGPHEFFGGRNDLDPIDRSRAGVKVEAPIVAYDDPERATDRAALHVQGTGGPTEQLDARM
jgi:hypothetical protein